jgi:hypothetical protein
MRTTMMATVRAFSSVGRGDPFALSIPCTHLGLGMVVLINNL